MSKNINVNPGQYKVAGRERQGEDLAQSPTKQPHKPPATEKASGGEKKTSAKKRPSGG